MIDCFVNLVSFKIVNSVGMGTTPEKNHVNLVIIGNLIYFL